MEQSTSDSIMNWIAGGNQIAMDWYTLTHQGAPAGGLSGSVPRYVPPNLVPGYTAGTTLAQSPLIILGVIAIVFWSLMK